MKFYNFKNLIRKKPKGQSLLTVMVITTLCMMLLTGAAGRVDLTSENIERTNRFDHVLLASESQMKQIRAIAGEYNCRNALDELRPPQGSLIREITTADFPISGCHGLYDLVSKLESTGSKLKIGFGGESKVQITSEYPLNLTLPNPLGFSEIRMECLDVELPQGVQEMRILVTVFAVNSTWDGYDIYKFTNKCPLDTSVANGFPNHVVQTSNFRHVANTAYPEEASTATIGPSVIENIKFVRFRVLTNGARANIKAKMGPLMGPFSTNSFELMIEGKDALGASVVIVSPNITVGAGTNEVPYLYDFVFLGNDEP